MTNVACQATLAFVYVTKLLVYNDIYWLISPLQIYKDCSAESNNSMQQFLDDLACADTSLDTRAR